ncbi:ABC transporter substrate-binding protein [Variovorax robiniae]|uniref:ABC transporter substrate-binding protein n=1 Tax=Variovorax robiniae TaxID=1836199 RepID=A0ABU8X0Y4_9BURK
MNKRRFLLITTCGGLMAAARVVSAQPGGGAPRRVGVFSPGGPGADDAILQPYFDEMRRLGWLDGRNVVYDRVFANDHMELAPGLAAELVSRKPDLIVAISPPGSSAVKRATSTIPTVFAVVVDPLAAGLVGNLAHPGGNVTGVTQSIAESLMPKRIELVREVVPGVKQIGLLGNPLDPGSIADQAALAPLLANLGLRMVVANGTNPQEFDASVASLVDQHVQAIVVANGIAVTRRAEMIAQTNRARIPVFGFNLPMAAAGALLSFGPSMTDQLHRAAHLADKILRGTRPGDIPVEAASVLELVVNQKSARLLGIQIPQSVLVRADRVIE